MTPVLVVHKLPAEWIFDVWTRPVVGTKVLRVAFPPEVTRPYVRTTRQFEAGQNLRFRGRLN